MKPPINLTVWFRMHNFAPLLKVSIPYLILSALAGGESMTRLGPIGFQSPTQLSFILPLAASFFAAYALMSETNISYPDPIAYKTGRAGALIAVTIIICCLSISYRILGVAAGGEVAAVRNTIFFIGAYLVLQRILPRTYWIIVPIYAVVCMFLGYSNEGYYFWALPLWDEGSLDHMIFSVSLWSLALLLQIASPSNIE